MLRALPVLVLLSTAAGSTPAWADDAQREVRAALEEQLPSLSTPLRYPSMQQAPAAGGTNAKVDQASRGRVSEAAEKARGLAQGQLKSAIAAEKAHGNMGQAGQSANGQSRAEAAKKKERGPRGPKP